MNVKDYVGKRGEILFCALITRWCDGEQWFDPLFLGDKAETRDFIVHLIGPSTVAAAFHVQVKSPQQGYTGTGAKRRLNVKVSKEDVDRLKRSSAPAYVVGIDIVKECGFL